MVLLAMLITFPVLSVHGKLVKFMVGWPFENNMVLQRGCEVPVRGTAKPGSDIAVAFHGQKVKTTADSDGKWKIFLEPMKAGGSFVMKINNGAEQIVYKNIMLGDVWFLSGQSNMQFLVSKFTGSAKWLKDANYPDIRLSTIVTKYPPERPVWKECTLASAKDFSALGFLFGRERYKNKKVSIGLLCALWMVLQ